MLTDVTADDRVVVITGAARGIGAQTARRLVDRGFVVGLIDVLEDEVAALAAELGPEAVAFPADVADPASIQAAVEACANHFGAINAVVANAGIAHLETCAANDPANFLRTIEVNLVGPWHTARAALPHLRRSRGYLMMVASVAAAMHPPFAGAYAASKAGLEALANVMRIELEADGIDVGVAYFPWIDTPMVRDAFAEGVGAKLWERWTYPLDRRIPVEEAGAVMATGIERRARRVYTPRWVRAMLVARAALPRVLEAQMRRAAVHELVREFEAGEADAAPPTSQITTLGGQRWRPRVHP